MPADMSNAPSHDEVDRHVGARLKLIRSAKGLTQNDVGRAVGLSLQQIQKYEHGTNRISANMLWSLSNFLGVEVSYFFEGLGEESSPVLRHDFLAISDTALKLQSIKDNDVRRKLMDLVETFSKLQTTFDESDGTKDSSPT